MPEHYSRDAGERRYIIADIEIPWSLARRWRTHPQTEEDVECFVRGYRDLPLINHGESGHEYERRLIWYHRGQETKRSLDFRHSEQQARLREEQEARNRGARAYRFGSPIAAGHREPRDLRRAWREGWEQERLVAFAAALPKKEMGRG